MALTGDDQAQLEPLREEAHANGAQAEIVDGAGARELEPLVTDRALAALHIPDDGIIDSLRLTIGYAELAAAKRRRRLLSTPVTGFDSRGRPASPRCSPPAARSAARYVVNAAGVEADHISALAGGEAFRCWPRQGQYWLLDRELGGRFAKVVGGVPTPGHPRHLLRPHHQPLAAARADRGRPRGSRRPGRRPRTRSSTCSTPPSALVPAVRREYAIKTFAANRPASDTTYRLEPDRNRGRT